MEVHYTFLLGPVAVAGVITVSRKKNGETISPVTKFVQLKPGLLITPIGPYEDSVKFMDFLTERYKTNPDMGFNQAAHDLGEIMGVEVINTKEMFVKFAELGAAFKSKNEGRIDRALAAMENDPVYHKVMDDKKSPEEKIEMNKTVTQIHTVEASAKGFECWVLAIGEVFTYTDSFVSSSHNPSFNMHRIDPGKIPVNEEGQQQLDLMKKMTQYLSTARKNPAYACNILKTVINEHHYKNTIIAHPLEFLQVGPHTDYRWIPLED